MAAKRSNGRNLEEAVAILLNNQAQFVGHLSRIELQFAEIRSELAEIKKILIHHERILDALPQAIRAEIGFKAK
ncbi:MAG: hypothetical protein HY649_12775 [Acidobacteria bacterium]|nr:hypothetical protein [Acidobacteriota bacterium]